MTARLGFAVALVIGAIAVAQEPDAVKGADEALLKSVRVVAGRIAAIADVQHPPEVVAVRANETARSIEIDARTESILPKDKAAARGRAWRDLGLGDGTEPAALAAALASDLPGMTLDRAGARLLVDPERLRSEVARGDPDDDPDASVMLATGLAPDEPVAGHYSAHAMLDGSAPSGPMTTDAQLARAAMSEGAANVAALVLLFGGVGLETEVVSGAVRPEDVLGGRLVPEEATRSTNPILKSFVEFVYLDGFAQASAIVKKGGFKRLAQERTGRRVTRDVIHVDRPPAPPVSLAPPVFTAAPELRVADQDSLGEQGVVTLVSLLTGKDNLGMIAGDGWRSDALWRFEPGSVSGASGPEGLTVWATSWTTDEDARDFKYSLERCLQARFPGEPIVDGASGERILRRSDRVYRIETAGLEVRFRAAPPNLDARIAPEEKKKVPARPAQAPKK